MRSISYIIFLLIMGNMTLQASCLDLVRAYPNFLSSCRGNTLIWRDGTKMRYDDGRKKSYQEMLDHPDLEDTFHYHYPKGARGYGNIPRKNFDPGRIRYEPLLRKMYGNSPRAVERNLKMIYWLPRSTGRRYRVRITRVNGVARQLQKVSQELDRLVQSNPKYLKYLVPLGGTFKWRRIARTHRLSAHSFGIAMDINVRHSNYWCWNRGSYRYCNQIPLAIVKIFEKHGFIWGGKWYHYDTMHFEYRPELL